MKMNMKTHGNLWKYTCDNKQAQQQSQQEQTTRKNNDTNHGLLCVITFLTGGAQRQKTNKQTNKHKNKDNTQKQTTNKNNNHNNNTNNNNNNNEQTNKQHERTMTQITAYFVSLPLSLGGATTKNKQRNIIPRTPHRNKPEKQQQ